MKSLKGVMYGSVVVMGAITAVLLIADRAADLANVSISVNPRIKDPKGKTEPRNKPDVEEVVASALSGVIAGSRAATEDFAAVLRVGFPLTARLGPFRADSA